MVERVVYGLHAVRALLERRPEAILRAQLLTGGREVDALAEALAQRSIPIERTTRAALDRLTAGGRHQGVLVEVRRLPPFEINAFEELVVRRGRELRVLVLDGVEDPRNLGACLRTADAAGVDAVVTPRVHAASLTPAAAKAATGAAETVPILRAANLARLLAWLKRAGVWVVGADHEAPQSLYEAVLSPPIAVVMGGEGAGLRRLTRDTCDELVAIPMRGGAASLNVSVAAGVVLFELERQCLARAGTAPKA